MKNRLLGVVLAIYALLLTGLTPAVADEYTPPAEGEYAAAAPKKHDATGTEQDKFKIPEGFDVPGDGPYPAGGWYEVKGRSISEGWHKTKGATSITIEAVSSEGSHGTWILTFSTKKTGKEAKNRYRIKVGKKCFRDAWGTGWIRKAKWIFTNVADKTKLPVGYIYPDVQLVSGGAATDTPTARNVRDGKTVRRPVMIASDHTPGLKPGRYTVKWHQGKNASKYKTVKRGKFTVPKCGRDRT